MTAARTMLNIATIFFENAIQTGTLFIHEIILTYIELLMRKLESLFEVYNYE